MSADQQQPGVWPQVARLIEEERQMNAGPVEYMRRMILTEEEFEAEYTQTLTQMTESRASDEEIVEFAIRAETARGMRIGLTTYDQPLIKQGAAVVAALRFCGRLTPKWEQDLLNRGNADEPLT